MADPSLPVPMMAAACLVSTEATFVEEDASEHDEHILGIKLQGMLYLGDMPVGAQSHALLPKEFVRNLRDALSEWLNDGGHFHASEDEWTREPEHVDLPSEDDEEGKTGGEVSA